MSNAELFRNHVQCELKMLDPVNWSWTRTCEEVDNMTIYDMKDMLYDYIRFADKISQINERWGDNTNV